MTAKQKIGTVVSQPSERQFIPWQPHKSLYGTTRLRSGSSAWQKKADTFQKLHERTNYLPPCKKPKSARTTNPVHEWISCSGCETITCIHCYQLLTEEASIRLTRKTKRRWQHIAQAKIRRENWQSQHPPYTVIHMGTYQAWTQIAVQAELRKLRVAFDKDTTSFSLPPGLSPVQAPDAQEK
jgi:hypothetical protein